MKQKPEQHSRIPTMGQTCEFLKLWEQLAKQVSRADRRGVNLPPAIIKTSRKIEKMSAVMNLV